MPSSDNIKAGRTSLNMLTGQNFKNKEVVLLADQSSCHDALCIFNCAHCNMNIDLYTLGNHHCKMPYVHCTMHTILYVLSKKSILEIFKASTYKSLNPKYKKSLKHIRKKD